MLTLLAIFIAVAGFWVLAYMGAPLLVSSAAIGVYIVGLYGVGIMGPTAFAITGGIYAVLAIALNLRPIRRLITKPVFAGFKAVLPGAKLGAAGGSGLCATKSNEANPGVYMAKLKITGAPDPDATRPLAE